MKQSDWPLSGCTSVKRSFSEKDESLILIQIRKWTHVEDFILLNNQWQNQTDGKTDPKESQNINLYGVNELNCKWKKTDFSMGTVMSTENLQNRTSLHIHPFPQRTKEVQNSLMTMNKVRTRLSGRACFMRHFLWRRASFFILSVGSLHPFQPKKKWSKSGKRPPDKN